MKLVRIDPYAKLTKRVDTLFDKTCKVEAKWNRMLIKIGTKGDSPPILPMKRLLKTANSIQKQLNELGFAVKD